MPGELDSLTYSDNPCSFPQSFLIGVVVPDPDSLPSFAAKIGVKGSFEELCQDQVSMGQNVLHRSTAQNVFYANMTENVH